MSARERQLDQTIFRVVKPERYAVFATEGTFVNDKSLSYAARGMLTYLCSKPPDWETRLPDLIAGSPGGRHVVRTIIRELKEKNYMKRVQRRGKGGQFFTKTYVSETPFAVDWSPPDETVLPWVGFPPAVNPPTVNPPAGNPSTESRSVYLSLSNERSNDQLLSFENGSTDEAPAPSIDEQVNDIFGFWQRCLHHPDAKLIPDGKRDRNIRARLDEGYAPAYIKLAIVGTSLLPHNMGNNERGRRFDDIELICRDSTQVENKHTAALAAGVSDAEAWLASRNAAAPDAGAMPSPPDPTTPWGQVFGRLQRLVDGDALASWFQPITSPGLSPTGKLLLEPPAPMVRDWIRSNYRDEFIEALGGLTVEWVGVVPPTSNGKHS